MSLGGILPLIQRVFLVLLIVIVLAIPRLILSLHYADHIHTLKSAPAMPTAVVFGAGLHRDGQPTTVLADRVTTAAALYQQGKVSRILMSGTVRGSDYDEPSAMRSLALKIGVPAEDILVDTGGNRTLYTCLRARQIFGVEQALLISQRFHLPRALVICDASGVSAVGVAADLHPYRFQFFWELREIPATLRAIWDAYFRKPSNIDLNTYESNNPKDG